jgi:hypothetical protein
MGICISRRNNNGVSQLSSATKWFQRRHTSWQHCVVLSIGREPNPRCRRQACQRIWLARHGRQCLGVVPGLVWALFISKRDEPHRTHYCFVPFGARRPLGQPLQKLPRVGPPQCHARRLLQRRRLPSREKSVVPFSVGRVRGLRQSPICHTPVYGQKSLIFGSFLPASKASKGEREGFQLRSTLIGLCAAWGYL